MTVSANIFAWAIVLFACLLRSTEAVTCTADPTVAGCIDCATSPTDAECVAEAAAGTTTTVATPTTTVAATAATTLATDTATTTTVASTTSTGGKRKVVRISKLRYTAVRRIHVNKSGTTIRTTSRNTNRNLNRRRVNVRRRNGNVRVIVG